MSDSIQADINQPILFRTASKVIAEGTTSTGSIWLRSDQYYSDLEDSVRNDTSEGVSHAKLAMTGTVSNSNGMSVHICGTGSIGQAIRPHYILSLHSLSISTEQRTAFGGHTFGVRNVAKLAAELLYRCSLQLNCRGYRFGAISYRHTALAVTDYQIGSAAIGLGGNPPTYVNPIDTDVLRKAPVWPFVEQDEWRIVIFTDGYSDGDASAPVTVNVDPSHFYNYDSQ